MNEPLPEHIAEAMRRAEYIGSSDIAAILGISKWATPLAVYYAKVEPERTPAPSAQKLKIFRRGKLMEPVIIEMSAQDYELTVVARNRRYRHPEFDFLRAEVDFEHEDPRDPEHIANGECKSVNGFAAKGWGNGDEEEDDGDSWDDRGDLSGDNLPIEYAAQTMYSLAITGRQRCYVYALFGADQLQRYVVERDDELCESMIRRAVKFWQEHVLARIPPDPVTLEDAGILAGRLRVFPVTADETALLNLRLFNEAKAAQKAAKEASDELKTTLALSILKKIKTEDPYDGPPRVAMLSPSGSDLLTWNKQSRSGIDGKRLTKERPDIARQYQKVSEFRVFRTNSKG